MKYFRIKEGAGNDHHDYPNSTEAVLFVCKNGLEGILTNCSNLTINVCFKFMFSVYSIGKCFTF